MSVDADGTNRWTADRGGRHVALLKTMPDVELARIIEDLMMRKRAAESR